MSLLLYHPQPKLYNIVCFRLSLHSFIIEFTLKGLIQFKMRCFTWYQSHNLAWDEEGVQKLMKVASKDIESQEGVIVTFHIA